MRRKKMLWESKRSADTGQFETMLAPTSRKRFLLIVRKVCAVRLALAVLWVLRNTSSRNGFFGLLPAQNTPVCMFLTWFSDTFFCARSDVEMWTKHHKINERL